MNDYDFPMWQKFQDKIVAIVDSQDEVAVPYKAYAQTYARHIIENLHDGIAYGYTAADATKTQLLYVLSNLDGTSEEDLMEIQKLASENGIDVSDVVKEMLEGESDDYEL